MAYLVTSLRELFLEINRVWPNRDHRTDGWIGDSRHCPGESDHCADWAGRVHAIDIDKGGINPDYVVSRLTKYPGIIRYINWNRKQYHVRNNFQPRRYTGSNPHTSHIHVSIEHTDRARNYQGGYGIRKVTGIPISPLPDAPETPEGVFNFAGHVQSLSGYFLNQGNNMRNIASVARSLRTGR